MKATLIFVAVIGMSFLANAGRKCYICDGKECESGLGKVVDCSTFACGVSYDISGSTVAKGAAKARYCMQPLDDSVAVKPEYACDFWKSPTAEIISDGCYCDTDLCNGEEPSCETRSIQHSEVSEVLADKCAPEIAKRKAAA